MKSIRLVGFLIVVVCGSGFFLFAQTGSQNKPRQWVYKDKGADGEKLSIIITQGKNGYELGGEYIYFRNCHIHGTYFPATGRLKGRCEFPSGYAKSPLDIEGSKIDGGNGLKVEIDGKEFVAWRDGVKPPSDSKPKTTGSSTAAPDFPNLAGTWICKARCPAGGGVEGKAASISQNGRTLTFTNEGGGTSSGEFKGSESVVAKQWGISATVEDGGKRLRWSNGTIWVKQ